MKVEGTPYEVMKTAQEPPAYRVMRPTTRPVVTGGAPIMLSVAGPFETRQEANDHALQLAKEGR